MNKYLIINEEVKNALCANMPVVALESTIISHGMPYPRNMEMAATVEKIVRSEGAVPATIAVLDGRLTVGLNDGQMECLAKKGQNISKVSRRDIPYIVSKKLNGATTVASTMIIAAMAGIRIFATGGIGGVHRNAETTMDISADLEELARTDVAVICAGAKSILDLGLTLEYLETKGVPVWGYRTDRLPAFYTRSSAFGVDCRMERPGEIAAALRAKWGMGLSGGVVIANPVPKEYSLDEGMISGVIDEACREMDKLGIKGKSTTPFLLAKIKDITKGVSLDTNVQLVYNNAKLAAAVACELKVAT